MAFFIYRNEWGYASNTPDFNVISLFDKLIQNTLQFIIKVSDEKHHVFDTLASTQLKN